MIKLQRYNGTAESSLGLTYLDGMFEGYMLEPPDKSNQRFYSRIPAGVYPMRYRKEETPMTLEYRELYDWFKWHLEICEVKDRDYIYIHIANWVRNPKTKKLELQGCMAPADGANNNEITQGKVIPSTPAYKRIYLKVSQRLDEIAKTATNDLDVFVPITISDEHFIR